MTLGKIFHFLEKDICLGRPEFKPTSPAPLYSCILPRNIAMEKCARNMHSWMKPFHGRLNTLCWAWRVRP